MVPFAGWEMPLQYRGIVEEHLAVRRRVGVFDVSHMARFFLAGADAGAVIRRTVTYDVLAMEPETGHYSVACDDAGGILDDPYVYRLGPQRWMVVGNAARREVDLEALRAAVRSGDDVELDDRTEATAMLAVQGPQAASLLGALLAPEIVGRVEPHHTTEVALVGYKALVSRTGYTGEDGFELVLAAAVAAEVWDRLLSGGAEPCGLGARDTLRLEAALALYGNDIDVTTDPFEAGLGWVVSLEDAGDFRGRAALVGRKAAGRTRALACIRAAERGPVFRHGCAVLAGGARVGGLTSGGYSPVLETSIGMGYLPVEQAKSGTRVEVEVRGRRERAEVVRRPFYRRAAGSS